MSHGFFYEMQRDARAAFFALHATVRSLLTRGQSLESLADQSDDLVRASIVFSARAERVRQELQAQLRMAQNARRRKLTFCAFALIALCSLLYFAV